jgi:hypothetical protein
VEWQRLKSEVTAVTVRVGGLLRASEAAPLRVSWSAAEVGAHLSVDPAAARRAAGVYHLGLRGDGDWTYHVHDGAVTVQRGRPERADVHISADPVVFLRNAYGRLSPARAALTGGIVMWGRRPWLARPFGAVFVRL